MTLSFAQSLQSFSPEDTHNVLLDQLQQYYKNVFFCFYVMIILLQSKKNRTFAIGLMINPHRCYNIIYSSEKFYHHHPQNFMFILLCFFLFHSLLFFLAHHYQNKKSVLHSFKIQFKKPIFFQISARVPFSLNVK